MRMLTRLTLFCSAVLAIFSVASVAWAQEELVTLETSQIVLIHDTEVAVQDPGIVESIAIETGDDVSESQVLVKLNSEQFRAEAQVAGKEFEIAELEKGNRTSLEYATKSKEVAQKVVERLEKAILKMKDVVSKTELDQRKLELEQADATVRQAEHEMKVAKLTAELRGKQKELAEIKLKNRDIVSPLDGRVDEVLVEKGEYVAAGQVVARIINLKKMRIKASLPARYFGQVRKGQVVVFEGRIGETAIRATAKVTYLGSRLDNTKEFPVWADVENKNGNLIPGVTGSLTIYQENSLKPE